MPANTGIVSGLFGLGLFFALLNPGFATPENVGHIVEQSTLLAIMAVGMTYALVSGEIDLSVGSVYAVASVTFALLLESGAPLLIAIALAILVATALGALNALLSIMFSVSTIIVTLGTLNVYLGLALWLSDGLPVSDFNQSGAFWSFARETMPGPAVISWLPLLTLSLIPAVWVGHLILTRTAFGHHLFACGSNLQAGKNAGISAPWVQIRALAVVGFAAGVAGVLGVAQVGSASPGAGQDYNLTVIAAVIIGGASIYGGRGSVIASLFGALLIGEVRNGLVIIGVNLYGQTIATGSLIILAVAVDKLSRGDTWYVARARSNIRKIFIKTEQPPEGATP